MTTQVSMVNQTLGVVEVRNEYGNLVTVFEPTVDILQVVTTELVGPAGPPGPFGPAGVQGPPGPVGPFAPQFEQRFASPVLTWLIVHNLGVYPVVTLYDLDENEIGGDITKPDRNTVVVSFEVPFAGIARLKA